jgi:hypothetical protein
MTEREVIMKKRVLWSILIAAALLANGCGLQPNPIPISSAGETIAAVKRLTDRREGGCDVGDPDCGRDQLEFDVNRYFSVFDHLSIQPGYTLDYVYLRDFGGAKPVVYAREINADPYDSYEAFVRANHSEIQGSHEKIKHAADYLRHIQIDDTPQGYFQFVVLSIMGDQFYLRWHANYNDETATVRAIVFSEWGGFSEIHVTISRAFPHDILRWRQRTRIPYWSGIGF